jgi:hypothetical protein
MQHDNCIVAIDKLKMSTSDSNVSTTSGKVQCQHKPTPCDWVGNDLHYACLNTPMISAQKVYNGISSGGLGNKIIVEGDQTR